MPKIRALTEAADAGGPYLKGSLTCFAVDNGVQHQVKWNHLLGTATVYQPGAGGYECNVYAFLYTDRDRSGWELVGWPVAVPAGHRRSLEDETAA